MPRDEFGCCKCRSAAGHTLAYAAMGSRRLSSAMPAVRRFPDQGSVWDLGNGVVDLKWDTRSC